MLAITPTERREDIELLVNQCMRRIRQARFIQEQLKNVQTSLTSALYSMTQANRQESECITHAVLKYMIGV